MTKRAQPWTGERKKWWPPRATGGSKHYGPWRRRFFRPCSPFPGAPIGTRSRSAFRDEVNNKIEKELDQDGQYLSVTFTDEQGGYNFRPPPTTVAACKNMCANIFPAPTRRSRKRSSLSWTPATYDDGFHKMSIARWFFGEVDTVKAWVDMVWGAVDAPAVITWKYQDANRTGVWEVNFSAGIIMNSAHYGADERVEIAGSEEVIYVTRCASRLTEAPALILYRGGEARTFDDLRDDWGDSFHDCGWDFIDSIIEDRAPTLSGDDGKAIMQFWKAVYHSSREGGDFRPDEMMD